MAGSGYGVTPMSRLSQSNSSRQPHTLRPKTGKSLEISSYNGTDDNNKKKGQKRKTLSSRYTADVLPKRRKLCIGAVKELRLENNHEVHKAEQLNILDKIRTVKGKPRGKLKTKDKARAYRSRKAAAEASSNTLDIKANCITEVSSRYKPAHTIDNVKGVVEAGSPDHDILNSKRSCKLGISGYAIGHGDSLAAALNLTESLRAEPDVDVNADGLLSPESVIAAKTESSSLKFESKEAKPCKWQAINLPAAEFPVCEPSAPVLDYEAAYPINERCSTAASPDMHSSSMEGRLLRPRKHSTKESEDRLTPLEYLGKRVVVYWPHSKAWFAGKVMSYDESTKKHSIKYDDGDEESILFRRHKVVLERQLQLSQSAADPFPVYGRVSLLTKAVGEHSGGEDVDVACKLVHQAENGIHDDCVLEDSALLSDVAQEYGPKSSPVRSVGALKRTDAFTRKDLPQAPKSGTSSLQANIGESEAGNGHGDRGGLVYVRRAKNRQMAEAPSSNMVACRNPMDENNCMGDDRNGDLGPDIPSKRKKSKILLRQADENDPPPSSLNAKVHEEMEGGISPEEQAPRKRNKKSLSGLIGVKGAELGKGVLGDSHNGKAGRRPGKKRGRKHKLAHLISSTNENMVVLTRNGKGSRRDMESAAENPVLCDVPEMHTPEPLSEDAVIKCTLYLLVPVVSPILFSWHLFNILVGVKLCEGGSFDGRFYFNGSHQDWELVFQRALSIIKAMPLGAWANNQGCGRLWQCRILHEFWVSLSGCGPGPCTDFGGHVSRGAASVMVEYFRGAKSCSMSSREALNLLVCYFLKPYIVATVCEKGAPLKVGARQFLLLEGGKGLQTVWERPSVVESFSLQLGSEGGDLAFLSYLALFTRLKDWPSEEGLFGKEMEECIASARDAGHAEWIAPVLSIKPLDHLGWQVTTTHVSIKHGSPEATQRKPFTLEQGSASLALLRELVPHRWFLPAEAWNAACHRGSDWLIRLGICGYLCKVLLCLSALQKALLQAAERSVSSADVSTKTRASKIRSHSQANPLQVSSTGPQGNNAPLDSMTSSGRPADLKTLNLKAASVVRPGSDAATKIVKIEPDATHSRRNSSLTTESNGAAVKEESSVDMYSWRLEQTHGVGVNGPQERCGLQQAVVREQPGSQQIDREYYAPKRSKDTKKVKKHRPPHHQNEGSHIVWKDAPSFCFADIVISEGGTFFREKCARVELQLNTSGELTLMARCDGKVYEQKVAQGSSLSKGGPDPRWESGNGWALEFPDKQQWKLFRCMYNDSTLHNARAMVKEIPIPPARPVAEYLELMMSAAPHYRSAIRYYPDDEVEFAFKHGRVLYDLDTEDEVWLQEANNTEGNTDATWPVISDLVLERMIDRLEKEAYRRGNEPMCVQEAVELFRDLGVADNVVQSVHSHWLSKRHAKGKALLRYFQPPLWEQYQRDLSKWEAMMESCPPNMQSQLLKQHPRPVMSAFCLQSRSVDVSNRSKRVLRQRSQRKIKPSVSSSEESQRVSVFRNADQGWQLAQVSRHRGRPVEQEVPESVRVAQVTAAQARRVAVGKAVKSQRRFLEFDSALQRAWALLLEYEVVTGGHPSAHDEVLETRMAHLFSRCSSLLRKGGDNDPSEDEGHSHPGQVGEDFLQAFSNKCSIVSRQQEHQRQVSDVPEKEGQ